MLIQMHDHFKRFLKMLPVPFLIAALLVSSGILVPVEAQAEGTAAAGTAAAAPAGSPLALHGALSVQGTNLVDAHGSRFQLKGVSTHGIAWYPQYVKKSAFQTLRDKWGANLIRLAMYTQEYGGYLSGGDQTALRALIDKGVAACSDLGMYCIIDWHILSDGNPAQHQKEAVSFFQQMSARYADHDNVLYEICNEPNGSGVTWETIRPYANAVIKAIRANDPDAVILVGTPTWSQDVDSVAADPVAEPANVMYTLHFYAATHKSALRKKLTAALKAGTPVFISEFSICSASGSGSLDYTSAAAWKKLIQKYNLSYAGWSLSNKSESSALIASSCSKTKGWTVKNLSASGKWLRKLMLGK